MPAKNILFLGFGDIASRTCALLPDHRLVGVARSLKKVPARVEFWQGAADGVAILERLAEQSFDAVVVTLTPTEYSDKAYQVAYVDTVSALVQQWQLGRAPGLIVFISSTSVYHQNDGEWVDEDSPTSPTGFAGQRLLEAEQRIQASGLPACIVRFAGIYGPGRDFLLRQVRAGNGGSAAFTNRIHAQDCAGIIAFLLQRQWAGQQVAPLYLGCDSAPAPGAEVRRWLAAKLGEDSHTLRPTESSRGGNKRCSNKRLLATGYQLRYPSYQHGYGELLGGSASF